MEVTDSLREERDKFYLSLFVADNYNEILGEISRVDPKSVVELYWECRVNLKILNIAEMKPKIDVFIEKYRNSNSNIDQIYCVELAHQFSAALTWTFLEDEGLKYANFATKLFELLLVDNSIDTDIGGRIYQFLCWTERRLGDYDASLKHSERSIELFNYGGLKNPYVVHPIFLAASVYVIRGEYEKAQENILSTFEISERFNYPRGESEAYNKLCKILRNQGILDQALESANKGYEIAVSNSLPVMLPNSIHEIILTLIQLERRDEVPFYLSQLEKMKTNDLFTQSHLHLLETVTDIHEACNAEYLKSSKRIRDRAKAEALSLKKIRDFEDKNLPVNTIPYLFNVLELLLIELKSNESEEIIEEIQLHIKKLEIIANDYNLIPTKAGMMLFHSKFALIKGKFEESKKLNDKLLHFTENRGLKGIHTSALKFQKTMDEEFEQMQQIINKNENFASRLKNSSILEYVKLAKTISKNEE